MRQNYNEWMAESVKELTPAGKFKRPSYETVVNWVDISWNAIDVGLIQRSFKCCGISNKRDGTEDNLIFDFECLRQTSRLGEIDIQKENDEGNNIREDNYYNEMERNYDNEWND